MMHSSDDKSIVKMLLCESVSIAQATARRGFFLRPKFSVHIRDESHGIPNAGLSPQITRHI